MPATNTRSQANIDAQKLKHALCILLDADANNYNDDDMVKALIYAGVQGFNDDFICLTEADLIRLTIPGANPGDTHQPLPIAKVRKLIILSAFYQAACRTRKGMISIISTTKIQFDEYRTGQYDPNKPILPWNTPLVNPSDELSNWKKIAKPNRGDYKEFRDETTWSRSKERITTTLHAHDLHHLIDENHVPTNIPLDKIQSQWLYKIFQDIMQAPTAKTIVTNYLTSKDTRRCWKEICEHFDQSMSTEIKCNQVSSYLTSNRFHRKRTISSTGKRMPVFTTTSRQNHSRTASSSRSFTSHSLEQATSTQC
jgi:hypothetical protein